MFLSEKYKNNILNFLKFLKNNALVILLTASIFIGMGIFYIFKNNTYSSKIDLLVNLEVFNEIKLPILYTFDSEEFNDYIHDKLNEKFISHELKISKSKSKKKIKIKDSIKYFPSIRSEDPFVSVVYSNKSEELTEMFAEEFLKFSNEFFTNKKNSILDSQILKLQEEYNNIKKDIDVENTNDPQLISLISRLTQWKVLRNQNIPMISIIQTEVYPTLNKKLILAFSLISGLLFGIFIALLKETVKELKK